MGRPPHRHAMPYDPESHHRSSIRLKGYDYSQAGAYFVTICTHNKACVFGDVVDGEMRLNEYGAIVKDEWLRTDTLRENVVIDEYIIMPNHIHGIVIIMGDGRGTLQRASTGPIRATHRVAPTARGLISNSIGAIIGQFKSIVTKDVRKMGFRYFKWQRNYYEHVIRNEDKLNRTREYVLNNPLQWQFDRENPGRMQDEAYDNQWGCFEEIIYGKS